MSGPVLYAHLATRDAGVASAEPAADLSPLPRQHAVLVDAAAVALSDLLRQSAERAPGLEPATRAMALRLAGSIRGAVASYCGTAAAAAEAAGGEHV